MIRSYRKSTHILILLTSFLLFGFILVFSLGSLNSGVSVQGHSTMDTTPEQAMYPRAKPNSPYVSLYDSTNEEVSGNEEFSVTNKLTPDADGLIHLTDNVIFMVDMPEDAVTLQTIIFNGQSETNEFYVFNIDLSFTDDAYITRAVVPLHSLFPNGLKGHIFTVAANGDGEVILKETILNVVYDVTKAP